MFRVVGIDLSLTGAGVARSVGGKINTARFGSAPTGTSLDARLDRIRRVVRRVRDYALAGYEAEEGEPMPLFVIEGPSLGSNFGQPDERAGARWILINILRKYGPVVEVPPKTVKSYIASNGNASKEDVVSAVTFALNVHVSSHDEGDALALMAMGARRLGSPLEIRTNRLRITALDSVQWPELVERKPA